MSSVLYHEDCNTQLRDGFCPTCKFPVDTQSTYLAEPGPKANLIFSVGGCVRTPGFDHGTDWIDNEVATNNVTSNAALQVKTNDAAMIGIGGAPTRATTFPEDAKGRKQRPVASGVIDYFPDALVAVAEVSWKGNEQHNAGQPLHWARSKSGDEADALLRHFMQRGLMDSDGVRHSAKLAWRALALLQKEIEGSR